MAFEVSCGALKDTGNVGLRAIVLLGLVQSGEVDEIFLDIFNLWNSLAPFAKILKLKNLFLLTPFAFAAL